MKKDLRKQNCSISDIRRHKNERELAFIHARSGLYNFDPSIVTEAFNLYEKEGADIVTASFFNTHVVGFFKAIGLKLVGYFALRAGMVFYAMIIVPFIMKKVKEKGILGD